MVLKFSDHVLNSGLCACTQVGVSGWIYPRYLICYTGVEKIYAYHSVYSHYQLVPEHAVSRHRLYLHVLTIYHPEPVLRTKTYSIPYIKV